MGQHLIHTQRLDLRYADAGQAKSDMDQWSGWYHREFLPVIAEVLDELEIPGKTIRLEKLEIDLGRISGKPDPEHLKRILREALKTQMQRQMPELLRINQRPSRTESLGQSPTRDHPNELEHLAYLLEKGRQPWWAFPSKKAGIRYFIQKLFAEKNQALKNWLESQALSLSAGQRLVNHLSYPELEDLVAWVFPESARTWELFSKSLKDTLSPEIFSRTELETLLSEVLTEAFLVEKSFRLSTKSKWISTWLRINLKISPASKIKTQEIILPILELICDKKFQIPTDSVSETVLKKWLESPFVRSHSEHPIGSEKPEKHRISEEFQNELKARFGRKAYSQKEEKSAFNQKAQQIRDLETDETFPIFNAGLVLTAPFLTYFFRGIGLVENKEFVSKEAQHRAALLIQALLDESFAYEESELLLNKILCGIHPDEPIAVSFSPTENEREEIKNLLDAMVSHWTALKSTSGPTMAKGFFPREGSLKRADKGFHLHIPRISIDILLNRLPWTISIIKLPWMEETLFTKW